MKGRPMCANLCKLKKALFGLKQAPRTWYERMDKFMMSQGFTKNKSNSNFYFKVEGRIPLMIMFYVNDLFLTREDELIEESRRILAADFSMKHLGMVD